MKGLDILYEYALQEKIFIYFGKIGFSPAVTFKECNDNFNIAIDPCLIHNEGEEKIILMHELSHIAVNAFYSNLQDIHYRRKMEARANRWLIQFLVPLEALREAISHGYYETWELADYFEVPEDFITQAMAFYKRGESA